MNNNFGIFARQDEARRAQEAERRERSNQKRIRRELERFSITGKITRFLEKTAEKNKVVNDAVNQISNPQASIPQISVPAIRGNEVEIEDPIRFGSNIEIPTTEAGGGAAQSHPFKITSTQDPDNENQYIVTVAAGTLNGVIASDWNAELTVPAASLRYIVLSASANNNAIVSTSMSADSSPPSGEQSPQKWALPTSFKVILGLVLGPQVWQVVYDNLSYASAKRITTDRANPAIGQLPYDNWYIWQLQP